MFSMLVVLYLFLGGAGAGACAVAALLGLLSPRDAVCVEVPSKATLAGAGARRSCGGSASRCIVRAPLVYRKLLVPLFAVALAAVSLGIVCLLLDLGRADRVLLLLTSPAPTHIAVGAWALVATAVLSAVLLCAWNAVALCFPLAVVRAMEVLAIAVSFVAMAYTGLLLQTLDAVPLWGTVWLPVVFVLSSLSCGLALTMVTAQVAGSASLFGSVIRRIAVGDAAVITAESVASVLLVATALHMMDALPAADSTSVVAASSAAELLAGEFAWLFWGVFGGVGMAAPFAAETALAVTARRTGAPMPALAAFAVSACVLAGGLALRFCLVQAGAHPLTYLPFGG